MTISLTYQTTTIQLPVDLLWNDEHTYRPVSQTVAQTLSGGVIVEAALMTAGRPITLQPEDENSAWMTLTALDALKAWAAVPGREMTLSIRGTDYSVVFRHQDGAIDATPVIHYATQEAGDFYLVTLRFMEI